MGFRFSAVAERFRISPISARAATTTAHDGMDSVPREIKGLFVECGKSNRLTEQEIDYLTVVGTMPAHSTAFATSRLDPRPSPSPVSRPGSSRLVKQVYEHIENRRDEHGYGADRRRERSRKGTRPHVPFTNAALALKDRSSRWIAAPSRYSDQQAVRKPQSAYTGSVGPVWIVRGRMAEPSSSTRSQHNHGAAGELLRVIQEREGSPIGRRKAVLWTSA